MKEHFNDGMRASERPEPPEDAFLDAFVRHNDGISNEAKELLEEKVRAERGPWSEPDHVRQVRERDGCIVIGYLGGESYYYLRSDSGGSEGAARPIDDFVRVPHETSFERGLVRKMETVGFDESVVNRLLELLPKLGLGMGASALFLGPSRTPLQFLVAGTAGSAEILENDEERREWILATSEKLGLSEKMTIRDGQDADVMTAGYPENAYDLIVALSILDLVGENPDLYRRILRSVKGGGKIAIGHHDIVLGAREKLLLERYASDLGYSLHDMSVPVDDGHDIEDPYYNRESYLFEVRKRIDSDILKQQGPRSLGDTLRLFTALESLGGGRRDDE